MTRHRWIAALICLIVFWLLAGAVWLPWLQRRLEKTATRAIAGLAGDGYPAPIVHFSGQQATVSGKVRNEAEKTAILRRLTHDLRVPALLGANLNPVTRVHDALQVAPFPAGWLMLVIQGPRGVVYGMAATPEESRDLGRLFQDRWAQQGGRLTSELGHDFDRFDESQAPEVTVESLPHPPKNSGGDSAQVFMARTDQAWERVVLEAPDTLIHSRLSTYPISDVEWQQIVQPALARCRVYQTSERERLAEAERQAKLPPPHVIFAHRDRRLLLRGEVATIKIKRELLNEIITAFPNLRVLDDLRVNSTRRNVAAFGPLTGLMIPDASPDLAKNASLGLPEAPWQPLDWRDGMEAADWQSLLPQDLPYSKIKSDWQMVQNWLQGETQGIPKLPIAAQPSFLTLALLPEKVIVSGQLAEEPHRARLAAALRNAYGNRAVILAEGLLARGTCEPAADVEQTVRSLPPLPKQGDSPLIAFARPGQVWSTQEATPELLQAGQLAKSGLLPADFPSAMAEDTLAADAYDYLRHYWQEQNPSPAVRLAPVSGR